MPQCLMNTSSSELGPLSKSLMHYLQIFSKEKKKADCYHCWLSAVSARIYKCRLLVLHMWLVALCYINSCVWIFVLQLLILVILTVHTRRDYQFSPGTLEISTPPEIALGTLFHVQHGTKTSPAFLPVDGEGSWSLLTSSVSLLSGGTVQPGNTYSCILKMTGQVWESQKRISINTNHMYH